MSETKQQIGLDTLIESKRIHVPYNSGSALNQGSIVTRNTVVNCLLNIRSDRTSEERKWLVEHLDEIRDNKVLRDYCDRQMPFENYSWARIIHIIEQWRDREAIKKSEPGITQAREEALNQYMPQNPVATPAKQIGHTLTEKAVERAREFRRETGSADLVVDPPKRRHPETWGGSTDLQRSEQKEDALFARDREKRLEAYYSGLGVSDITLDCRHKCSSKSPRVRDAITGLTSELSCLQCGQFTKSEKILAQVKTP